jgi:Shikimate kinase
MIQLVGPGGAGKTTVGSALAQKLALRFVDLDAEFTARYGDISVFLDGHGYQAYATRNVGLYSDVVGCPQVCVAETVRRRLRRPFARSAEREEQVIRARFPVYMRLSARKVETMQPVDSIVTALARAVGARQAPGKGFFVRSVAAHA